MDEMMLESIENENQEWSLRDAYFIFFRHKYLICIIFLSSIVLAFLLTFFLTKQFYQSEAKLLVRIGREAIPDPTATVGDVSAGRVTIREQIYSAIEIIKSRDIAENVVDTFGVEALAPAPNENYEENRNFAGIIFDKISTMFVSARDALKNIFNIPEISEEEKQKRKRDSIVMGMMESLEVNAISNSNIIAISYKALEPQLAHDVLNKIINVYLEKHISIHFSDSSYQFFDKQTKELRSELEQTEQMLSDFKKTTGIASIIEQRNILLERIERGKDELKRIESELAASNAKVKILNEKIASLPKLASDNQITPFAEASYEQIQTRLYELRLKEQELLSTFTEESIPIIEIRRQIKEVESQFINTERGPQVAQIPGDIRNQLQLELMTEESYISSLTAKAKVLKKQLPEAQAELSKLIKNEIDLGKLERNKEIQESNFHKYNQSLEQTRIDRALKIEKISNISIAQPATYPVKPEKSKKKIILALGIIVGICGGIGLAFLLENLDHTFKKPEDSKKKIDLPALMSIPNYGTSLDLMPDTGSVKNLIKIPQQKGKDRKNISTKDLSGDVQRCFEILLHRVIFSEKKYSSVPHIFAITSCRKGEGVTTVAANFAVNLARIGKGRVLLVDMNILKFDGSDSSEGLFPNLGNMIAVRKGESATNLPSRVDTLYMMNYSKNNRSTDLEDLQDIWKKEYEFVVMDIPSVFDDTRVATLSKIADEVILVVEAERERWEVVRSAKSILVEANANLVGIILNKRNFYIPNWLYKTL